MGCKRDLRKVVSRRSVLRYGVYGGLAGGLWLGGCGRRRRQELPNIVMILVDTLRADHMSVYGYGYWGDAVGGYEPPTTPNLERLAGQGVVFKRVIAPSSWTKTSMASIMTGCNPSRHGAQGVKDVLPRELTTIAEALAGQGYYTIGVNTNPWLKPIFGFNAGFHVYHTLPCEVSLANAWDVNRSAVELLEQVPEGRPVFLYLHYMDVHSPYAPRREFFSEPPVTIPGLGVVADDELDILYRRRGLDAPAVVQRIIKLYDGEIRGVDAAIDQLLKELQRENWFDNTIVAITSDHGEEFCEHGGIEHGKNLYPEVYEVPLIFIWPDRLPAGVRIGAQVRSIDIAPTLFALAGLDVPKSLDGKPLLPMENSRLVDEVAISAVGLNDYIPKLDYAAVVSREHLYVREKISNKVEFYDLRSDPGAQHNLGASHPSAAFYAELEGGKASRGTSRQVELDEETRNQLKSLGYLR
jgi:arylsulfatase A-like enzyme